MSRSSALQAFSRTEYPNIVYYVAKLTIIKYVYHNMIMPGGTWSWGWVSRLPRHFRFAYVTAWQSLEDSGDLVCNFSTLPTSRWLCQDCQDCQDRTCSCQPTSHPPHQPQQTICHICKDSVCLTFFEKCNWLQLVSNIQIVFFYLIFSFFHYVWKTLSEVEWFSSHCQECIWKF